MMTSHWLPVDRGEIRRATASAPNISTAISSVSPYDIPEAIRCSGEDAPDARIVIEFQYATEEPLHFWTTGAVRMGVGKNSGRLYKVEIDGAKISLQERVNASLNIANLAIKWLAQQQTLSRRTENYNIAQHVVNLHVPFLCKRHGEPAIRLDSLDD